MAKEKERNQRLHEKHQLILADMLRDEENKYCADCQAKGSCANLHKQIRDLVSDGFTSF